MNRKTEVEGVELSDGFVAARAASSKGHKEFKDKPGFWVRGLRTLKVAILGSGAPGKLRLGRSMGSQVQHFERQGLGELGDMPELQTLGAFQVATFLRNL